jgi:Fic family protein
MARFLKWFNASPGTDLVIKSALAHFWFVTIHPFDDGNGRIARAIADMMLARSEKSAQRFYSMSAQIQRERKEYYDRAGKLPERGARHYALDRVVSELLETRHCRVGKNAGGGVGQSAILESLRWPIVQSTPARIINRLLDGFEGKLDLIQMGKADEVFAGHRTEGYYRSA